MKGHEGAICIITKHIAYSHVEKATQNEPINLELLSGAEHIYSMSGEELAHEAP